MHNVIKIDQPGAFAWGNYEGFTFVESGRFRTDPKVSFTVCMQNSTGKFFELTYMTPNEDACEDTVYDSFQIYEVELKEVLVTTTVKDWVIKYD